MRQTRIGEAMRSTGKLFEKALIGELVQQGYSISRHDAALDHDAKLDFVINRFPGNIMHHQVGVQVTIGEINNVKKMQEFVAIHSGRYRNGIQRSVYMQADENLDLDSGGHVIGTAITQFQFDRRFASERVIGVEIGEDLSYALFSLSDRIASAAKDQVAANLASVPTSKPTIAPITTSPLAASKSDHSPAVAGTQKLALEGRVTYWIPDESGYGFILAQDNETYYLHANAVADHRLRDALNVITERSRYPLQEAVEFEPGFKNKSTDSYKPAKNVRFATGKPFIS
jgi:hypothetical protein